MSYKKKHKSTIASSEYHKHVPAATTPVHIDKATWEGIGLDVYRFPRINEGVEAPPTSDYVIGYVSGAPRTKAYYGLNGAPWKPLKVSRSNLVQLYDADTSVRWQWRLGEDESCPSTISLFFDAGRLKDIAMRVADRHVRSIELPTSVDVDDNIIGELLGMLAVEAANHSPLGRVYAQTVGQFLGTHLLRWYCNFNYKIPELQSGLSECQLDKTVEYIDSYLHRNIDLETLAALCGLSAYHFIRLFKQSTGQAPHQFIIQKRMERARQLLAGSRLSVLDIAIRVGYRNQSHFAALFKRRYGATPGAYRKNTWQS